MPYPVMNTLLDAAYPTGALNYWLSSFTRGLSDELIDTVVERFETVPSPMTVILFEHFHGAVTRVAPTATAVPHREAGFNLLLPSEWLDPAETEANIALDEGHVRGRRPSTWSRAAGSTTSATTRTTTRSGPPTGRTTTASRGQAPYDPQNVFHLNHNIAP